MKKLFLAIVVALGASAFGAGCTFGPDAYNGPALEPAPPDAGDDGAASGGTSGDDAAAAGGDTGMAAAGSGDGAAAGSGDGATAGAAG